MSRPLNIHQKLINRCKKGDRRAQAEIYELYAKPLFNVALRILNNREEAEDVLQESFINAFQKMDSYREEATFGAWMKRIVVNRSLNQIKKKKVHFVEVKDEIIEEDEEDDNDEMPFTIEQVKEAVNRLADGFRVVFSLYMFEDHSHKKIAEHLGITISTSKSQLNRAKKKVYAFLLEKNDEKRQA